MICNTADRVEAYKLVDKFNRLMQLKQEQLTPYTFEENEERYKLEEDLSLSLYWMQRRLTQVDLYLAYLEKVQKPDRDQITINRLRNIRDALPWNQDRWSGEVI